MEVDKFSLYICSCRSAVSFTLNFWALYIVGKWHWLERLMAYIVVVTRIGVWRDENT